MSTWKSCPECGTYTSEIFSIQRGGTCGDPRLRHPGVFTVPTKKTAKPRPSWDDYFFSLAKLVSTRATCPRASIGVVLVSKDHRVISTGFNGAPAGKDHCADVGCDLFADHCVRATHAEVNAVDGAIENIAACADWDLDSLDAPEDRYRNVLAKLEPTAYVIGPRPVCSHCARTLRLAGVVDVKWREA